MFSQVSLDVSALITAAMGSVINIPFSDRLSFLCRSLSRPVRLVVRNTFLGESSNLRRVRTD